jgi:hypothetical protein
LSVDLGVLRSFPHSFRSPQPSGWTPPPSCPLLDLPVLCRMERVLDDVQQIHPHVLWRPPAPYSDVEEPAVIDRDGVPTLLVPISLERAASIIAALGYEDMEARPATLEEIEEICTIHGLGCVGLCGLDGGDFINVLPAEALGLVLKESDR